MANLLKKFRIKFSELIMLKGLSTKPRMDTLVKHRQLIQSYCHNSVNEMRHLEEELHSLEEKTQRQLRIHELVVEHSSKATLVVMSLPMPRRVRICRNPKNILIFDIYSQEAISAALYMSWLEMLTTDIKCPVVLARGNQTPVLTFYS